METKAFFRTVLWMFCLAVIVSGCLASGSREQEAETVPTVQNLLPPPFPPTPTEPEKSSPTPNPTPITPPVLATPHAQQPAAGICGAVDGELALVEIFPDIPSPRCLQVTGTQRLLVTNQTGQGLRIRIGHHDLLLPAGEKAVIDAPLGNYLAPGVHLLDATPFSGPELWLVE